MTYSAFKNIVYGRKFRLYLCALPNIIIRLINVEQEAGGWRPCTRFDASIWSYTSVVSSGVLFPFCVLYVIFKML